MKSVKLCFIVWMVLTCFTTGAFAFRCGSDLVSSGDTKTKVLVTCGKPTTKDSVCEGQHNTTTVDKYGNIKKHKKCARKVEVWRYNCGDNSFIYALTFENGVLTDETTEGRGKGKSDCLGK